MEHRIDLDNFETFIEQQIKIVQYAKSICIQDDIEYEFKCPICGGAAAAAKSSASGTLHAFCNNCNTDVLTS